MKAVSPPWISGGSIRPDPASTAKSMALSPMRVNELEFTPSVLPTPKGMFWIGKSLLVGMGSQERRAGSLAGIFMGRKGAWWNGSEDRATGVQAPAAFNNSWACFEPGSSFNTSRAFAAACSFCPR